MYKHTHPRKYSWVTLSSFLRIGLWVETKCGKYYPESVGERRNQKKPYASRVVKVVASSIADTHKQERFPWLCFGEIAREKHSALQD